MAAKDELAHHVAVEHGGVIPWLQPHAGDFIGPAREQMGRTASAKGILAGDIDLALFPAGKRIAQPPHAGIERLHDAVGVVFKIDVQHAPVGPWRQRLRQVGC